MKRTLLSTLLMLFLAAVCAQADILVDTGFVAFSATGTQLGRLSRNGTPQDWANQEPFPGVINLGLTYGYETFTVNSGPYSYIQIDVDSVATTLFMSAYLDSYNPTGIGPNNGLDVNWLGDAGTSGNNFGNPIFFQIVVAPGSNVVVLINETTTGGGNGQVYDIAVEGFCDTSFTEATNGACPASTNPVPEPGSTILFGTGLSLIAQQLRRRRSA